ncbi:hypothetical protein HJC23_010858 [Cyclotella cryptica]|uniref:START domain-containing protein n=1 Tax=Cyclotella cryptica TaxID=29204 RepID=A0ABD3QPR1_9STRA
MNRCGCGCKHAFSLHRMPIKRCTKMASSSNVSCAHARSKRRRSALPTILVTLLVLQCYHLCSSHQTRSYRSRRRNNTGFYYGLRDDDMNVFRDDWPLRWHVSNGDRIMQASLFGEMIDKVQYFTRGDAQSESRPGTISQSLSMKRKELMQSLSQTLMQSLLLPLPQKLPDCQVDDVTTRHQRKTDRILCYIRNRSILPEIASRQSSTQQQGDIDVVHTASIVRPKPKTQSRKKRRKNNTGFYYGIREDVLPVPERPVADGKKPPSNRFTVPKGTHFDPNAVVSNDGSVSEKLDDNINIKERDATAENRVNEEKPNERRENMPLIKQTTPNLQSQLADCNDEKHRKEQKQQAPLQQQTLPDEGRKKNRKNKHQVAKKEQRTQPSSSELTPSIPNMIFDETLQELRQMRNEIIALREELRSLKGKFYEGEETVATSPSSGISSKDTEKSRWWHRPSTKEHIEPERSTETKDESLTLSSPDDTENEYEQHPSPVSPSPQAIPKLSRVARRREFEKIGRNVESWACRLLFEEKDNEGDGWKKIACNNFVRKKFNPDGRTQVYLKWMPDSRYDGDNFAYENDMDSSKMNGQQDYPCIKCYSVIDAPMDKVCSFLANEKTIPMYNELVDDHCDIEEISPHSKITWCKMPKVMFVKPRDFVTYCSHRWWRDGTQVIVNQACEHEDMPGVLVEGEGDVCRGYALRGANFISKDPDDPNKTRITMLAHANPGGGLPQWAMTTAVNAVVQIEPFKLFHNINEGVSKYSEPPSTVSPSHQLASINSLPGRSNKPAGLAQGGGLKEKHTEQLEQDDEGSITVE